MIRFEKPVFIETALEDVTSVARACKEKGYYFVQICAIVREDACELLYAFDDPKASEPGLIGYLAKVPTGAHVPSITDVYPEAFVFENETHDLFGVDFDGISIDFKGEFYTVAVAYPMNPHVSEEGKADE